MEPSIHLSTQMNTPTLRTAAGTSQPPTDTEFISTSPYCRQSLSPITSLSGTFGCDTQTLTDAHKQRKCFVVFVFLIAGRLKTLLILKFCLLNEPSYMTVDTYLGDAADVGKKYCRLDCIQQVDVHKSVSSWYICTLHTWGFWVCRPLNTYLSRCQALLSPQ